MQGPLKLQVEASHMGAGSIVAVGQSGRRGLQVSFPENLTSTNYSVIEKEALALVWALPHFDVYVGSGVPLVVFTDHNLLTFLKSLKGVGKCGGGRAVTRPRDGVTA